MKILLSATLQYVEGSSCEWCWENPTVTDVLFGTKVPEALRDWREEIKLAAADHDWKTEGFDLDTVAGLIDFLAWQGMLGEFERLETYLGQVYQPAGAVVVGQSANSPAMIFWEEDMVYPLCLECCLFSRRKCGGKHASELQFYPYDEKLAPDCFLDCPEECRHDGECPRATNYPPEEAEEV